MHVLRAVERRVGERRTNLLFRDVFRGPGRRRHRESVLRRRRGRVTRRGAGASTRTGIAVTSGTDSEGYSQVIIIGGLPHRARWGGDSKCAWALSLWWLTQELSAGYVGCSRVTTFKLYSLPIRGYTTSRPL